MSGPRLLGTTVASPITSLKDWADVFEQPPYGRCATCRRPGCPRSEEKRRFGAQSCCGTSQRCVRPR
eukprot:1804639-Prymnesium_polylepis.1